MMDPLTQVPGYGQLLFDLSMIDSKQQAYMESVEAEIVSLIKQEEWLPAFRLFDSMLNDDEFGYPSYYTNVTGLTDYLNFDAPIYPNNPFGDYLNRADVKAALFVAPEYVYAETNNTVELNLLSDWMKSIASLLPPLLEQYDVLIYNGQNDIILNGPACENFLQQLEWTGAAAWRDADRQVWKINPTDSRPAGYAKQSGSFSYVIVRDAGHLVPMDQPERAYDMITRFVDQVPFGQ